MTTETVRLATNDGEVVVAKILYDDEDKIRMFLVRESVNHFTENKQKYYTDIIDYTVDRHTNETTIVDFGYYGTQNILCTKQAEKEQALANHGLTLAQVEDAFQKLTAEENFTISLPKKTFTEKAIENFKAILASKANLIKSAIGIDKVDFQVSENELKFDWFSNTPSADEFQAYSNFICKVGELAKKQKRVTAKEREVENKRYAFRCFLLRIGLIGSEFKKTRKILLEKLAGNCAFRSGHRRIETLKTA